MKYMILIHHNPTIEATWQGFSDEERAEGWRMVNAFRDDLVASGELIVTEALTDPSQSRWVTVRDGQTSIGDGPFPEAKEFLAGFFLVEVDSLDRALERAARIPEARFGMVEVRPVLELGGVEM